MKIVNIIGGLGNQMFQYAFAMALRKKYPDEDILIDTSHFKGYGLHNGFELEKVFINLGIKQAKKKDIKKVCYYMPNYKLWRFARTILPKKKSEYRESLTCAFHSDAFLVEGDCYYDGYWQCAPYFEDVKEEIREQFIFADITLENITKAYKMDKGNNCGIHVRRGDYLKEKQYQGICDLDYYKRAIEFLKARVKPGKFYIFSNDMDWCEENIKPLIGDSEIEYVRHNTGKNSYQDIYLMEHCKHLIIANSSFSWWAAFLNKRKGIIISPKKWKNLPQRFDVQEESWTLI